MRADAARLARPERTLGTIAGRRLAFFRGSATDPESFVAALAMNSDITIVRDDPDELRLELSPPSEAAYPEGADDTPPSVNPNPI